MNERDMRMMYDGRNPYGSEGGYVVSSRGGRGRGRGRGRRGDRGMDYGDMRGGDGRTIRSYPRMDYDMARGGRGGDRDMGDYGMYDMRGQDYGDMARGGSRGGNRGGGQGGRGRGGDRAGRDYGDYDMARGGDNARGDYGDIGRGRGDGHYMHGGQSMGGQTYYPIEAMGRFNGYWGMPEQDFARGRDYGYDMGGDYARGGRRDYGDYGEGDYGDYGETLSTEELEKWERKLMEQLDEREKQMFQKDTIMQRAKQMGKPMEGFGEKELYAATLMVYTDYKQSIGQNPDLAVKLAYDWLADKDVAVKGAEKLAVYYDCIVEGED